SVDPSAIDRRSDVVSNSEFGGDVRRMAGGEQEVLAHHRYQRLREQRSELRPSLNAEHERRSERGLGVVHRGRRVVDLTLVGERSVWGRIGEIAEGHAESEIWVPLQI